MFDHVTIRVGDREASRRFYDLVLATLGRAISGSGAEFDEWNEFSIASAGADRPATRRLHVGFSAPSRAHVDEFWRVGTEAGYESDGEPGPRPQYRPDYYGSFLLDPDGNSAEAVHHEDIPGRGMVDHLWLRVADVSASKAFYETIAPHTGFAIRHDWPEFGYFRGPASSFSVISGGRTENVHMAFPASENRIVDAFHRAATAAGYRDNGAPAERAQYHPGYYSAFVLDPDGNNVEVVNHNRG